MGSPAGHEQGRGADPRALELETVLRPRDAFFARVEPVPIDQAVAPVAAEVVSPYPPGVPVLTPVSGSAPTSWTT